MIEDIDDQSCLLEIMKKETLQLFFKEKKAQLEFLFLPARIILHHRIIDEMQIVEKVESCRFIFISFKVMFSLL